MASLYKYAHLSWDAQLEQQSFHHHLSLQKTFFGPMHAKLKAVFLVLSSLHDILHLPHFLPPLHPKELEVVYLTTTLSSKHPTEQLDHITDCL